MHYNAQNKHTNIAITISIVFAILSIPYNVYSQKPATQIESKVISVETKTSKAKPILPEVQKPEENRIQDCDKDCKIATLVKIGIKSKLANAVVNECKEWSKDPRHCIIIASALVLNESGGGKSNACTTRNNCFWIGSGKVKYSSVEEWVTNWVQKYNRYWYKAKDMSFFYSKSGQLPPSRYCTSESSSNSDIGCPNWLAISSWIFKKLNQLF